MQTGVIVGNLLFMSGTSRPIVDGKLMFGKVGGAVTVEQGYQAARSTALGLLANVLKVVGSLDQIKRVVRITGFVKAVPEFTEHAKVSDGASDVLVKIFGDAGRSARSAPGAGSLPAQVPVILEGTFELH